MWETEEVVRDEVHLGDSAQRGRESQQKEQVPCHSPWKLEVPNCEFKLDILPLLKSSFSSSLEQSKWKAVELATS